MEASIVIPIGPGHEYIAARAIASAENQTVPCRVITAQDPDGHGAGWARNQGMRSVKTEWVVFLDADDWIEPNAVERLLWQAGQKPGRYIYPDWYDYQGVWKEAPQTGAAWCGGTWHAMTCLLPLQWVMQVGGFDETLPAGEDTEFFLRLTTSLHCGERLPEPLLHYSADGQRGIFLSDNPAIKDRIWAGFQRKYGGRMGCCGQVDMGQQIDTDKFEGDVLARALWGGNMRKVGPATGRLYPRRGNGARMWVDPRDVDAAPSWWRTVEGADEGVTVDTRQPMDITQMAGMMLGGPAVRFRPERNVAPPPTAPDIAAIIRMGREALG